MTVKRGYLDGPFGQIHYQVTGEGLPLVLFHQCPTSSRQYDRVLPLLADAGILAIAPDTPGFGMSDVPEHIPSIEDYASILPAILDHFNLEKTDILGHHTGAMIATAAAVNHPDHVTRVILNGPVPLTPEARQQWVEVAVKREKAWALKRDGSHFADLWERRTAATAGWNDLESMHMHVLQAAIAGTNHWLGHNAAFAYNHVADIEAMKQPCLIFANTGDGIYEMSLECKKMRPDWDYVELEGGTHDIVDEQPQAWAQAVINYIKG